MDTNKETMKSAVLKAPKTIVLETREKPRCGSGEALVKISAVSVCGSDIHSYLGNNALLTYPRVMGHETCGVIEEIDASDSSLKVEDKVILMPYLSCGECIACRRGKGNCCANLKVFGVHIDGALSEYLTIPVEYLIPVDDSISEEQLTLIEPYAISAHAISRAEIAVGEQVLIVGAGPIGLAAAELARGVGAEVAIAEISNQRRIFANEVYGFDKLLDPSSPSYKQELDRLFPEGVVKLIDSTGSLNSMNQSVGMASPGGRIVFVGYQAGNLELDDLWFHKKELEVYGSRAAGVKDFQMVIDFINQGKINPQHMITHKAALSELPEVFGKWAEKDSGVFKAVVTL